MKQVLIFLLFFLSACQGEEDSLNLFSHHSNRFSPEQRQALFPNELFTALVDRQGQRVLQKIIDQNGHYILDINENGDTALAVAIQFYNLKGALFIVKQLSPEHYLHQNFKGEGYLYLASQKGYVDLIQFLANRFYESKQEFLSDYEFSDLDMKTNAGERALHVAKNYMVAEALQHEYWRGFLEYPLRKFQYLQNNKGQNFLHIAVRDQNSDLLNWGLKQVCTPKTEWENKPFYNSPLSFLWQAIQMYGKPLGLDLDDIINTQDHEGKTAINFSAKNMFLKGIRILSSCQWTNYLLPDDKGNIPLQNFLLALDPLKSDHSQEVREVFTLLMESQTRLTWSGIPDHVNSINDEGESSLHISAKLVAPFFYNSLKKHGDTEQKNHQGQVPREIFQSKRKQLKQTGV